MTKKYESMTITEIEELPKVSKIEATAKEVEYLCRGEVLQDNKLRCIANMYNAETIYLNEYEMLLLNKYRNYNKYNILYPDIQEVFDGIFKKLEKI